MESCVRREATQARSSSRARRILVVDDHVPSSVTICLGLSCYGHVCRSVGQGASAISIVPTFEPDVVLLEWHLGDGSGRGLAERLRCAARSNAPLLHVIIVSTQSEPRAFRVVEDVEHYLVKPVTADEIDELLAQLA